MVKEVMVHMGTVLFPFLSNRAIQNSCLCLNVRVQTLFLFVSFVVSVYYS